jgi:hypothetical protein
VKDRDGESVIDQIKKIQVYEYEFKEDDSFKSVGFLAVELSAVLPDAVTIAKEQDGLDMVDYSKLTPLIVAVLKDLIEEVQDLNKEVKKLKKE